MPEDNLKELRYKLKLLKYNRNKVDVEDSIKVIEEQIKSLTPIKQRKETTKTYFKYSKYPNTIEEIKEMLIKGEEEICSKGYIFIKYKEYKAYKHRLVLLSEGYVLNKKLQIHHIDCNKLNNSIDNLLLVPFYSHCRIHRCIQDKNLIKLEEIIKYYYNNQKNYIKNF